MVKQLATADVCLVHVREKLNLRETAYQRNRSIGGHKGKVMESKLLPLTDLGEESVG